MILSAQNTIKTTWILNEETGIITLTFKDETEATILGTIEIEKARLHPFTQALFEVGRVFAPPGQTTDTHKTSYDNITNKSVTEFSS